MNKVIICGRATKDAEVRYTTENMAIARFTLAVDRKGKKDETDFINCVAFGKQGEFCEKYAKKGTKFIVSGRLQTGSYEKDGHKVYTTDVVTEDIEFAESKKADAPVENKMPDNDGFMNVNDDGDFPFGSFR